MKLNNLIIWFDGGVRKQNPGTPYGSHKVFRDDKLIGQGTWELFDRAVTNNVAEYIALSTALCNLTDTWLDIQHIIIYGDSELVRNQIGVFIDGAWQAWECNNVEFVPYIYYIRAELQKLNNWTYEHKPRKEVKKILGH